MRIIRSESFTSSSNSALNKAIAIANGYRCGEVNCSHMMAAIITSFDALAKRFQDETSVSVADYRNALEKQCLAGYFGSLDTVANGRENFDLNMDHVTPELCKVFSEVIHNAKASKNLVTPEAIYEALLKSTKSEVYTTLSALGIDPESVRNSAENDPLREMPVTSKFAVDMCKLAKDDKFDPIDARDDVIDSVIEILGRRQKGNPVVIGDPGVGKTAVIEGLAQRIIKGEVPNYMKNKHIISVDISGVVSGARFRGDFEERLNAILYETAAHPNVILFFDEFHMLMDAGSTSNDSSMTAANILKPAISKGDIRIIGATTTKEYAKFVEGDGAFNRRIQSVAIDEPSIPIAIKMIEKLANVYTAYHNCAIDHDVIEAAVKLSDRYITDKHLPDKAITVIDETAARLKAYAPEETVFDITVDDIRDTISKSTGIDVSEITSAGKDKLQILDENLHKHVIGQNQAIRSVVKAIRRAKAGIKDPNRPIGSFLFVGPTGVGKTELTKALATEFSGDIKNLIKFDMSEFMEKHSVSKLIGAPPGYVGFGDGGQLTEAVKRKPNSIILFDEIEKAHPDVFNIMLQILDDGVLTDTKGVHTDFKNCVIVMTSNAGYGNELKAKSIGFNSRNVESEEEVETRAIKALEKTFKPEFLNRLDKVVVFNSLSREDCSEIINLELKKLSKRLGDKSITLTWDSSVVDYILEVGYSDKYGARNLKRKVQECIEDTIADKIIDEDVKPFDNIRMFYDNKACSIVIEQVKVPVEYPM